MNYAALIDNRKSVRAFEDRQAPESLLTELREFYEKDSLVLSPRLPMELNILGADCGPALAQAAGYEQAPAGAPHYLVLSAPEGRTAAIQVGFLMEKLLLKLQDLGLSACWISFGDSQKVKDALGLSGPLEVTAIAAFGYGLPREKKLRMNLATMSCADIIAQRGYYAPKKDIRELVFVDRVDNIQGLDEKIGFYEDMLWQAFYACSKAPSYLNRQPYAFLLKEDQILLAALPDPYTDERSLYLDLGIVLLHFSAVAGKWEEKISWSLENLPSADLPEGAFLAACCSCRIN